MFSGLALGFVNHLLADETWACRRLAPFAGQTLRLSGGPLDILLKLTPEGRFCRCSDHCEASVTLTLPPEAFPRVLADRGALFAALRITGSAELAEVLGFIFRNLRWDVENDLSRVFGDIVARRLVQAGAAFTARSQEQAENLALNLAEYFTEENPLISRKMDVVGFARSVDTLERETARLEQRLDALGSRE